LPYFVDNPKSIILTFGDVGMANIMFSYFTFRIYICGREGGWLVGRRMPKDKGKRTKRRISK